MAEGSGIYPPNATDEVILVNVHTFFFEKFSLFLNMFDVFVFSSKQCCGSGMFTLDPGSVFFHPGSRMKKIPDSDPASKNFNYFNPRNCF
jgi:hypothetical protein